MEALAKLKPAFHATGTRHGRQFVADERRRRRGARSCRESRAKTLGLTPLARWVGYATAGVAPERFGIGPVPAVRKLLGALGLALDDIDLVELNEAFAAQVLACLRELDIDPDRLNVNGGAIALGHPLGCTGARLTTTLLHEMAPARQRATAWSRCASAEGWARRESMRSEGAEYAGCRVPESTVRMTVAAESN